MLPALSDDTFSDSVAHIAFFLPATGVSFRLLPVPYRVMFGSFVPIDFGSR